MSRTILNIFRSYKGIDVVKLPFLEELYEKIFAVPYVFLLLDVLLNDLFLVSRYSHFYKNFVCYILLKAF